MELCYHAVWSVAAVAGLTDGLVMNGESLINRLLLFKSARLNKRPGASVHMHRNAVQNYQANTVFQSCSK